MALILTNISLPDPICYDTWNDSVPIDAFLHLLYCWFMLNFVVTITFTFTLKVLYTYIVWACLLYSFDFIDTQCIQHAEFGSAVTLGLLVSHINVTYIPKAFLRHVPQFTSMSCHLIFQLPAVETIHYCIVVGPFCWNPRHVWGVIYLW